MKKDDIYFMRLVLKEAKKAEKIGEIPIGAIVVKDGKVISRSFNKVEKKNSSLMHAEIDALLKAQKKLRNWRLNGCTIYTNVEPCLMCTYAIILSRMNRVVFGCRNEKFGGIYSLVDIENLKLNHKIEITEGILKEESIKLLKDFFKNVRKKGEVVELV
uniref:tRNA-specific adenosine deaminase n=1 Tax=candidate division WOR-3 bacterium TaxID=2052148 RepID=A0A7C3N698_UNCW3